MNLERLLCAIGKQTFIKYYNYFKDEKYTSADILNIITEDYTDKSKRSRFGHARMIFNDKLNIEALKIIINSKVPEVTISEAKRILLEEETLYIDLSNEQKWLAIELLEFASKGVVRVEYGELSKNIEQKYGINLNPHTVIPNIIGSISELCYDLDLPLLSAIVVNKDTQKPGAGFYSVYDKKHNTSIKGNHFLEEKILKQTKQDIINCQNWNKLAEYLNIKKESNINPKTQNQGLIDEDKIIKIIDPENIEEAERIILSKIRIGQSDLREILLNNKKCCEICGIKNKELLITSHIKPWAKSDKTEKLDSENVLLLCPTHDALFDKGLISFNSDGSIIISKLLDDIDRRLLHLDNNEKIVVNSENKMNYLKYHRENIFKN